MLLHGSFARRELSHIQEAVAGAAGTLTHTESADEALAWLEANPVHALLCHASESEKLAVQTRAHARFSKLPVLALSSSLSTLDFVSAFTWGADDVVTFSETRPLLTRLRSLPKEPPTLPANGRGNALVAEADQVRRTTVARVLRNAGFSVRFAVTEEDSIAFSANPELSLVVANRELFPQPSRLVEAARASGSQAGFIVCTPPRDIRQDRAELSALSRVSVTDAFAAPENVLFVANELGSDRTSGRTSARIPFGTTVSFRGAGRGEDEIGFSYNISQKGMYVRTLALPEDDEVWLELCPPRLERRVRLVGRVAWRRPFNHNETATVPPGFGVEIVDGAQRDRDLWDEGYSNLIQAIG